MCPLNLGIPAEENTIKAIHVKQLIIECLRIYEVVIMLILQLFTHEENKYQKLNLLIIKRPVYIRMCVTPKLLSLVSACQCPRQAVAIVL